jgi:hypothetical protein
MGTAPAESTPLPRAKKRWWKWLLLIVALAALLFVFRRTILTSVCACLVLDTPLLSADYLLIMGGDRSEDTAADLYHEGVVSRVVIFETVPSRLDRLKVTEPHAAFLEKQLVKRQVPKAFIEVVPAKARSSWDVMRSLDRWLATRPAGTQVLICCERLDSRRFAWQLDQVLSEEHRKNARIVPVTHRNFDESTWWQSKDGIIATFHLAHRLGYLLVVGEDRTPWQEWEPDDYEAFLTAAAGEQN